MKLLELFSGIGGFTLGLEQAGFKFDKVQFSEIDKMCGNAVSVPVVAAVGKRILDIH